MSSFDDREKGFEAKYKHDQELRFKIIARRNRLLGEWAATQIGKSGDDIAAYAKEVVASDFDEPGDDDVLQKVLADLTAAGVSIDDGGVRKQMTQLLSVAQTQIESETD